MLAGTIGITGGVEPMVCAASGQQVQGRHANTYSIDGTDAYYRVLAKRVEVWDADPNNHAALVKEYRASKKSPLSPVPTDSAKDTK